MKRRDFLSSIAASATVPLLPIKVFAGTAATSITPDLFAKAAQWAGLWDHSTKSMLKYQFGLDDNAATGLFDALVKKQVIAGPDARGMSKVMISTYKNPFHAVHVEKRLARKENLSAPKRALQSEPKTSFEQNEQTSNENADEADLNDVSANPNI